MKVDAAGRVWASRERRESILDEFERSGLPATKFAACIGMKYPTLASWVQKRRRQRERNLAGAGAPGAPGAATLRWVEATLGASGAGCVLCVHLPGGARIEMGDAAQVALAAQLLRALAQGSEAGRRC